MIKSIIKANSWYDNLKEPKRSLLFFSVMIPVIISQYFLTEWLGSIGYIYCALFLLVFVIFRMVPPIVDIINWNKNSEKDLEN